MEKLLIYNDRKANSSTIWVMFLLLGWSYGSLGKIGKQILFYLTLGGFGFWALYRLFTLNTAIRKYNLNIAEEIGLEPEQIKSLGLSKN